MWWESGWSRRQRYLRRRETKGVNMAITKKCCQKKRECEHLKEIQQITKIWWPQFVWSWKCLKIWVDERSLFMAAIMWLLSQKHTFCWVMRLADRTFGFTMHNWCSCHTYFCHTRLSAQWCWFNDLGDNIMHICIFPYLFTSRLFWLLLLFSKVCCTIWPWASICYFK